MRSLIFILCVFFSINGFSQTKEIKASKKTLESAFELKDIITDIPADCKVQSYVMSFKSGNDLREYTCLTNTFGGNFKAFFSKKEKGFSFFIEKIKSGCGKIPTTRYKITID